MNKKFVIKVSTQELSRVVQEFLLSKGYCWSGPWGKTVVEKPVADCGEETYIRADASGCLYYGSLGSWPSTEYKILDAATQFGEIVTLFNEPIPCVINVKDVSGNTYDADFTKHKGCVTFGCASIKCATFTNLNAAYKNSKDDSGNYKEITSITIGKGVFTPEIIRQIVEHPDFDK